METDSGTILWTYSIQGPPWARMLHLLSKHANTRPGTIYSVTWETSPSVSGFIWSPFWPVPVSLTKKASLHLAISVTGGGDGGACVYFEDATSQACCLRLVTKPLCANPDHSGFAILFTAPPT